MFFNEMDILELRMNELHDVVDHYIIVESSEVFGSSSNKPLHLKNILGNRKNVTYVPLHHLEPEYTDKASGWLREKFQREALNRAIDEVYTSDQDVVIVSDVDEIPRPSTVKELAGRVQNGMYRMCLDLFYYNVNNYLGEWPWGTTIGTVEQYKEIGGVQAARSADYPDSRIARNAGWHLSYFGGVDRIRRKIESFSHSQDDYCKAFLARDNSEAAKDIANGLDIYRTRGLGKFEHRASNDSRLPSVLLSNPDRFKHFTEEHGERSVQGL
jgi:beta-1,4-mannosyl-glycoprotein beta-1,4-N-acetylglucosaminyltransferase